MSRRPFLKGIKRKVIAAFSLACLAIALALGITYYSFNELLNTVDGLTSPNKKIALLNSLYRKINQLDQLQRAEAIRNPQESYTSLLRESKSILKTIDTLKAMKWSDKRQRRRLLDMEKVVYNRDSLLLSYLKMKSEFVVNKNFSEQLDSLATIISWTRTNLDSSITTTERRTITTTHLPEEVPEEKSFFNRIFGKRRKTETDETRIEVQEEFRIRVDTLSIAQKDSAIAEIGRLMKNIEEDQRLQSRQMLQKELDLINNNKNLINQLLKNLREVEREEKSLEKENQQQAALLVDKSIQRIGLIMIFFLLGVALLIFMILTDITRSNILRQQLIKAKEEAEQSSQIKQRFLANMSHEIRTPLQSILGFAEQLKLQTENNQEAIQAIHTSSEHLLHIVNEILDYSKIESGKLIIEQEVFTLSQLLSEVEASIHIQALQKKLEFSLISNIEEGLPLVGDPFRIRQILYNLLGNAIKFTHDGSIKLIVETRSYQEGVNVRFRIMDTGIGMTPDEIYRAFEQFEQARASINRQYGGTGLGLTIVKKLVEAMHGNITVESKPNHGSTFTVELTFDKALEVFQPVNAKNEVTTNFEGKVMVVDDDPFILRLCDIILTKNKIDHVLFSESEEALTQPWNSTIKLVMLDIRMPRISGIDLCREIRARAGHSVKIIALTAHVLPQEKNSLIEQGFDHVLTKPFREAELLHQLNIFTSEEHFLQKDYLPQVDLSLLKAMTVGDDLLFQEVLTQFITDTRNDLDQLIQNMESSKRPEIRECVHRLAGRTAQVGLGTIGNQLNNIETNLEAGIELSLVLQQLTPLTRDIYQILNSLETNYSSGKTT